jgi:hypothetical protein
MNHSVMVHAAITHFAGRYYDGADLTPDFFESEDGRPMDARGESGSRPVMGDVESSQQPSSSFCA